VKATIMQAQSKPETARSSKTRQGSDALGVPESKAHPDVERPREQAHISASFDPREFRRALGAFPTGVAIITTVGADGRPVGLTCNSFSSVSLDPPLVLWSLRSESKSLAAFRDASHFAINILSKGQSQLSSRFASSAVLDKFEGVAFTEGAGGAPIIEGCLAHFHCKTFAEHEAGDHIVFIGQVEQFDMTADVEPLVFCRGDYMMLAQSLKEIGAHGSISIPELTEARARIYGNLLDLACRKGTDEDFQSIEDHLQEMIALTERGAMVDRAHAALQFFNLITRAAHNETLSVVARSLDTLMLHAVNDQATKMSWAAMHQPELTPIRYRILSFLRKRNAAEAGAALEGYFAQVLRFQQACSASTPSQP
jgi:flavin reductase (DIM6/NTAB) family NADH-FMN oxidoreductase RutF